MENLTCGFFDTARGERSRCLCLTHSIECVEEPSPSAQDANLRRVLCPITGDTAGFIDTRQTVTLSA